MGCLTPPPLLTLLVCVAGLAHHGIAGIAVGPAFLHEVRLEIRLPLLVAHPPPMEPLMPPPPLLHVPFAPQTIQSQLDSTPFLHQVFWVRVCFPTLHVIDCGSCASSACNESDARRSHHAAARVARAEQTLSTHSMLVYLV